MRDPIIIAALAGLGLCGCATDPSVMRQAALNCQAVGITQKDPQYAICTEAYARQHIDDVLSENYRTSIGLVPNDRRLWHQDVF
jgi:hypothetical protein